MARIASIATAVPEHTITREETRREVAAAFADAPRGGAHLAALVDRTGIETRHISLAPTDVQRARSLGDKSREYHEHAVHLAMRAVPEALARAELAPEAVDHLITVSCTGVMIPSLDAELMNRLPFRRDCARTPITELGCAAGAVALSRAWHHVRAFPGSTVLVVAVELCSLTFQPGDRSMTNVVASSLFADGAAAAVVTGRPGPGVHIVDARSELFPETQHVMGFDLRDGGLHIKLDRDVAPVIEREFGGVLARLLAPHGIAPGALEFLALHPGGRRLLEVMESLLGVGPDETFASRGVLRDYGNMSSATVLFVLDRLLRERRPRDGASGLLAAFGPGFSAEALLLRWAAS